MNHPRLSQLPPYAKFAVAIYMFLIACVLVIAMILGAYHGGFIGSSKSKENNDSVEQVTEAGDSEYDDEESGDDSDGIEVIGAEGDTKPSNVIQTPWFQYDNFKLGHAHINGQSLVFFTVVLLFVFTGASSGSKKLWSLILALSIIIHTLGLFYQHKPPFDIILRVSGTLFAVATAVMGFFIIKDIAKKSDTES